MRHKTKFWGVRPTAEEFGEKNEIDRLLKDLREKGGVSGLHKQFTYYFPSIARVFTVVVIFFLFVIARGYFLDAMRTEELIPKFIAVFIGLLISLAIVSLLVAIVSATIGKAIVSVTDNLLIIHSVFGLQKIRWEDIAEFGTYVTGRGRYARRLFYVKLQSRPGKRIVVCNDMLKNVREFIDIVFTQATRAKFVKVENVSWIPFTKEIEVLPWAQHDRSFLTSWTL